jgi:hypothetical protein
MAKKPASKAAKKRKGLLADSTPIMVRLQDKQLRKIERWIATQRNKRLGHSDAIRRLIDAGLKAAEDK